MTTPVATIGVRGGIAVITHCPPTARRCVPEGTQATNVFGRITVEAGGVTERITRPDFTTNVASRGSPPSPPVRASGDLLAQSITSTTSKPGQSGGTRAVPTDTTALASGTGNANAGLYPPTTASVQAQNTAAPAAGSAGTPLNLASSGVANAVTQGQQTVATNTSIPPTPPTPPVVNAPPTAYVLTTTAGAGSHVPFLTASFVTSGAALVQVTPVFGYRRGGLNPDGTTNFTSRVFQSSLILNGTGRNQTAQFSVMTATVFKSTNKGFVFAGNFRAAGNRNGSRFASFAEGRVASVNQTPSQVPVPVDNTGVPNGAFGVSQNRFNFTGSTVNSVVADSALQSGTSRNYTFDQTLAPTTTPVGLGANHPTTTLSGYAGGLARTIRFTGLDVSPGGTGSSSGPVFIVTNATNSPGDISISLQSGSRVSADFALRNLTATGAAGEFVTANVAFGVKPTVGSTDYAGSRGAYVDLTHFAALDRLISTDGGVTFHDDSRVNGQKTFSGASLVNGNSFGATQFTPCACYTQWGLWSIDTVRSLTAKAGTEDRTGIAFWVAGTPSTFAAMPATGSATYAGKAVASIATGPAARPTAQYIAAGAFTSTVNFGARTAAFSLPSFDHAAYNGIASFASGAATFGGTLTSSVPGRVMILNGSLFQAGAGNPVGEIGGSLSIMGTNYLGSGVFLGKK